MRRLTISQVSHGMFCRWRSLCCSREGMRMSEEWRHELNHDPIVVRQIGAIWGKSRKKAGGSTNLLLSHLLDTAAVAEQIWDHYLAPSAKQILDDVSGGRGRLFFAWLCGIHDCGKATPAFQRVDDEGADAVRRAGLTWNEPVVKRARWRHDKAGGTLLLALLREVGWDADQIAWLWPLVAGHHGSFPSIGDLGRPRTARGEPQGKGPAWAKVQRALVEAFTRMVGYKDLAEVQPVRVPNRAVQLQLSGFVVMADWIASDKNHFVGVDDLADVSLHNARERAAKAWAKLGLRGGWGMLVIPDRDAFRQRFGDPARPSQDLVTELARRMPGPGLLILEAPMGEGKTKAALLAAEILAARFGADGVYVGMPTQATSDPMFSQVRGWLEGVGDGLADQVALLHGKRRFNKEWRALLGETDADPDACYESIEEDDLYGMGDSLFGQEASVEAERKAPAEWFLGRSRGLLSPFVVGTIDQLLYAATRTKHVMLRAAGLMGKVVILDEVHAADVYMSQFLKEGLRWLGQAGVPVVLLSATLPPAQRRELVAAYLSGAASQEEFDAEGLPEARGYPNVTAACLVNGQAVYDVEHVQQWRPDLQVAVTILPETAARAEDEESAADTAVAALVEERLAQGGCALVIRNTVPRAQKTYEALRRRFGDEVRLLHGRMTAKDRAEGTEECLQLLGPPTKDGPSRPKRLILVATQLAEQSFDVDADLLVTDLTTIDLLLQRLGRLHRHQGVRRPLKVSRPEVVITGFAPQDGDAPWILPASEAIYGRYLLLRTAALVCQADGRTWSVPGDVPHLVKRVYSDAGDVVPPGWAEEEQAAYALWEHKQQERAHSAEQYLLTRAGEHTNPTLDGLHYGAAHGSVAEEKLQAVVRDGDRSLEVVLIRRDDRGYRTLAGRWLGVNGEALSEDLLEEVLGATVRLPAKLTDPAERELSPLDGWRDHPWLKRTRALILHAESASPLGDYALRYDERLGLVVEGGPSRSIRRRR
ncbi:CRISPR-associated helicase Cas3' [Streptosporangium sp. NPDC002544]|uniref:CRISPR-associated helicase Cas3' n=1 Tax=Streptosporangium sp. NPDC002544 TaxID=3154538 RepID=UPI00332FD8FD